MECRSFSFVGGAEGLWRVTKMIARINRVNEWVDTIPAGAMWLLRGVTSYEHYVNSHEHQQLLAVQP